MKRYYRTIWLSDIHLGSRGCQAGQLLDFLKHTESDYLILVGDIIDFWSLRRVPYWPTSHNTIVQKVLKKARHGTMVIYIPGNHDEVLRDFVDHSYGDIHLMMEYTHTLSTGETVHCLHGDMFDVVTRYHKWVAVLGSVGYDFLLWVNRMFNAARMRFGMGFWSLSAYIKRKIKQAVNFVSDFEDNVIQHAVNNKVSKIICGHIHHAEIRQVDEVIYMNCGDWVESCTALVEELDGSISLLRWADETKNTGSDGCVETTD